MSFDLPFLLHGLQRSYILSLGSFLLSCHEIAGYFLYSIWLQLSVAFCSSLSSFHQHSGTVHISIWSKTFLKLRINAKRKHTTSRISSSRSQTESRWLSKHACVLGVAKKRGSSIKQKNLLRSKWTSLSFWNLSWWLKVFTNKSIVGYKGFSSKTVGCF